MWIFVFQKFYARKQFFLKFISTIILIPPIVSFSFWFMNHITCENAFLNLFIVLNCLHCRGTFDIENHEYQSFFFRSQQWHTLTRILKQDSLFWKKAEALVKNLTFWTHTHRSQKEHWVVWKPGHNLDRNGQHV